MVNNISNLPKTAIASNKVIPLQVNGTTHYSKNNDIVRHKANHLNHLFEYDKTLTIEQFYDFIEDTYYFLIEHLSNSNIIPTSTYYNLHHDSSVEAFKSRKSTAYLLQYFVNNVLSCTDYGKDKQMPDYIIYPSDDINSNNSGNVQHKLVMFHKQEIDITALYEKSNEHILIEEQHNISQQTLNSFDEYFLSQIRKCLVEYKENIDYSLFIGNGNTINSNDNNIIDNDLNIPLLNTSFLLFRRSVIVNFNKKAFTDYQNIFFKHFQIDMNLWFMQYLLHNNSSVVRAKHFYNLNKSYALHKEQFHCLWENIDIMADQGFRTARMKSYLVAIRLMYKIDKSLSNLFVSQYVNILNSNIYNKANTSSVLDVFHFLKSKEQTALELLKYPEIENIYTYDKLYDIKDVNLLKIDISFDNALLHQLKVDSVLKNDKAMPLYQKAKDRKNYISHLAGTLREYDLYVTTEIINSFSSCLYLYDPNNNLFHNELNITTKNYNETGIIELFNSKDLKEQDLKEQSTNNLIDKNSFIQQVILPELQKNKAITFSIEHCTYKRISLQSKDYFTNDLLLASVFSNLMTLMQEHYDKITFKQFRDIYSQRERSFFLSQEDYKLFNMDLLFHILKAIKNAPISNGTKEINKIVEQIFIKTVLAEAIPSLSTNSHYRSKKI